MWNFSVHALINVNKWSAVCNKLLSPYILQNILLFNVDVLLCNQNFKVLVTVYVLSQVYLDQSQLEWFFNMNAVESIHNVYYTEEYHCMLLTTYFILIDWWLFFLKGGSQNAL